jgi:hypothetical protein
VLKAKEYENITCTVREYWDFKFKVLILVLFSSGMGIEDTDNNDVVFYVLLRAVDRFYSEYNRYPGYYDDQVETDVSNLKVRSSCSEQGSGS